MSSRTFPQAVLFDHDGTLVNSEPQWAVAKRAVAGRYGVGWSTEDDLATLGALAPDEGALVTAASDRHRGRQSGLELIRRVSGRQGDDNRKALDFLIAAHRRHPGEFATFDTNVMVVDLDAARRENLAGQVAALVVEYGATFREALNLVCGPRRTELDASWNHAPGYEEQQDPSTVSWRDTVKPWSEWATPFATEWKAS